jgi:hypothetical protein
LISPYGQQALRLARRSAAAPQGTAPPRLPKLGHAQPVKPQKHALKETSIRTEHVGRSSETTDQLERRKLAERSRALEWAAQLVLARMYTSRVVPGNVDGIANRVYEELGLAATGTSESAFKDRVRALGSLPGSAGSRTAASGSNPAGSGSRRGSAPLSLEDAQALHQMAQRQSEGFTAVARALLERSSRGGQFAPDALWSLMPRLKAFGEETTDDAFRGFADTLYWRLDEVKDLLAEREVNLSGIEAVRDQVLSRISDWEASARNSHARPAVVFDWDGTLDAVTAGFTHVPMHLTTPEELVVNFVAGKDAFRQYATGLFRRHSELRNDPGNRTVLIEPIVQLLPELIKAGIEPHIVTASYRENYEEFIRNQLKLAGLSSPIGVWQIKNEARSYLDKQAFINKELVEQLGLSIAAAIGDSRRGDEFPGAEFYRVPSFW